jgi:iron-sulfur cluster repair protein YtfE (RIC family)
MRSPGVGNPEVLTAIAELLESHVRFEEEELFPFIEQGIPESELSDLASAGRRNV